MRGLAGSAVISATHRRRHAWIVAPLVCLGALVGAPFAWAGAVTSDGTTLTFTAGAAEANHVLVLQTREGFRVVDSGAVLVPGAGCTVVSANEAFCDMDNDVPLQADISAGDMNDLISISGFNVQVTVNG